LQNEKTPKKVTKSLNIFTMRIKFFVKSLFVVGLLAVFALTLTACNSKFELDQSKLSPQGIALENYLPGDAMIVMTINKQDTAQKEKLDKLGTLFPEETVKNIYEDIVKNLQLELDQVELNFEEDILGAFGENNRILFAMNGNFEKTDEDKEPVPEFFIASTFQDSEKIQTLIDKLAENGGEKGELFGATTLDNKDMYLAVYKDTILITNKQNLRHEALKKMQNNEESLLNNELYKEAQKGIPQYNFGDFYINYENYFEFINALQEEDYPFTFRKDLKMAIAMGLYAEDEGVRMLSSVASKGGFNLRNLTFHEPYLYRGIPGKNLIMYAEVYDIKKIINMSLDVYEWDEETSKEMRKAELLIKKTIGIDLKEDILSWMDKGFAMVLQRNDSMVPAISFYIDAGSNPEGAKKIINILDTAISQIYDEMLANPDPGMNIEKMIKKEVVQVGKSDMNKFSFDFSAMSDAELLAAGLPSGIFTEPIEFYYGLTNNNYFVLSTYSGLDKDFGDGFVSVGSTLEVEEGRELIKDYPYNLSYISVEETFKYVDRIFADMEKVEGPMDEKDRKAYELVKAFLAPIKYMIAADQKMQSAAYLKIEGTVSAEL
jgi:hypothetical protein